MKRTRPNDGLEDFLKNSSEELHLHPSGKVWEAISAELHRKRRRSGWLASLLLLGTSLAGYLIVSEIRQDKPAMASSQSPVAPKVAGAGSVMPAETTESRFPENNIGIKSTEKEVSLPNNTERQTANVSRPSLRIVYRQPVVAPVKEEENSGLRIERSAAENREALLPQTVINRNTAAPDPALPARVDPAIIPLPAFPTTIIDSDPVSDAVATERDIAAVTPLENVGLPATIESITPVILPRKGQNKLSVQFNFTPTISYRKLSRNNAFDARQTHGAISPDLVALQNVNDAVTHKPNMGLEAGFTVRYPVSSSMRLQAGLQFNISRYDIKAFNGNTEAATVAFRDGGPRISATNYRNYGNGQMESDWLQNLYFQLSLPVGMEKKFGKPGDRVRMGVAGTLQPTYMLGDRAYLLSTDYKNYVEVPWLVRRWNLNTAVETFVAYSTGRLDWQVGPQVRYQLLSSFVSNYPVKENLFDFGLKLGVSLNKGR